MTVVRAKQPKGAYLNRTPCSPSPSPTLRAVPHVFFSRRTLCTRVVYASPTHSSPAPRVVPPQFARTPFSTFADVALRAVHTRSPPPHDTHTLSLILLHLLPLSPIKLASTVYSLKSASAATGSTATMEDSSHSAWATPHDIALQQMEYSRRQGAPAREAARRQQEYDAACQQPDSDGLEGLAGQMGGLGYGQSAPDPTQIQAGAELEYRHMQRRLHEAEQALAAERALRAQQHAPQPPHHPPPPPQHGAPTRRSSTQRSLQSFGRSDS